jgi:single-strand DNA-binding protein
MLNQVTVIGNLGADPTSHEMKNGNKVVNLSVATSEIWKDKAGEKQERTEWHRVVIFNDHLGNAALKYAQKGSQVLVQGMLQTRKWEKDGIDRYSTEIVVGRFNSVFRVLSRGKEQSEQEPAHEKASTASDDEIPF